HDAQPDCCEIFKPRSADGDRSTANGWADVQPTRTAVVATSSSFRIGYSVVMPYNNLTDEQISDIVDYIEALSS
ncbi:MAG: hypothetical protein ACKO2Q_12820, partial [Actinomycetota bacterium]